MSRLNEQLAAMTFPDSELDEGEMLTDVVLAARVTRLSDGRSTVMIASSDGIDNVTRIGLLECARQIDYSTSWEQADDDDGEL